jgi:hypothetical protein
MDRLGHLTPDRAKPNQADSDLLHDALRFNASDRLAPGEPRIERVPERDLGLVELPAKVDHLAGTSTREVNQAGPWVLQLNLECLDLTDKAGHPALEPSLALHIIAAGVMTVASNLTARLGPALQCDELLDRLPQLSEQRPQLWKQRVGLVKGKKPRHAAPILPTCYRRVLIGQAAFIGPAP